MWYLPLKWLTICSPCVQVSEERLIQLLEQINEQTQKKTKVTVRMLGTCWFDLYVSCSYFWVQCSFDVISASTMLSLTYKLLSYSWHIFLWQIQRRRNVFDDDEWRVKYTTSDMQGHMFQMLLCSVNCLFTNWPLMRCIGDDLEIGMSKVGTEVWFHSCVECVVSTCGSTYIQDGCSRK
jgi:hypothetical protein